LASQRSAVYRIAVLTAAITTIAVSEPMATAAVAAGTAAAAGHDDTAGQAQLVAESLGPGIVRFHASAASRDERLPSLALMSPEPAAGPAPPIEDLAVVPEFITVNGRHAFRIELPPATDLYGTGEVPGPLRRNGRKTVCWNFDAYGYGIETLHLYQSHPWVLAVRPDGSACGILADTSHRLLIDLTNSLLGVADGPAFPVIVIDRESPQAVLRGLAELIGTIPLPPLWALGYHQCRYSYYPDERVRQIAREFRRRRIPCDVVWLDIDYMDSFRCFTWSGSHFPDPAALMNDLHQDGFRAITIIDPGIKREPGYFVFDQGNAADAWVRTRGGGVYTGYVWPGECVFPDFTRGRVRSWWASLYGDFLAPGIDGIWNDMNEPAIFNVESKTMPLDNVHRADPELGGTGPHARYHNVYGMLMARATREGLLAARPDRRPFVLTRANFLGGQRFAATWTGDNVASWRHLDMSIPMVLNLGLSGQPFCGPDIGGFAGEGSGELFARWMGFGALFPFARGHTGKGNIDKEPWAFGPRVEATCRRALTGRYRLLPYLYTVFQEASLTGLPVWRPLFFADPTDPALRAVDDGFLIGEDLLVMASTRPRVDPGAAPTEAGSSDRPLPAGRWLAAEPLPGWSGDENLPRLLVREGAVLPLGPVIESTAYARLDTLTLLVNLDRAGHAEGSLYEDEGEGFGYRQGASRVTHYQVLGSDEAGEVRLTVTAQVISGRWAAAERIWELVLLREGSPPGRGFARAAARTVVSLSP
jgi:alpha-glucosidase